MEAISTTVPSINVRKLHSKPHYTHHLKPSLHLTHPHISTAINPSSISTKPTPTPSSHHKHTPHHLQSTSQPPPPPPHTHRNAATGYAAALIDAALSTNSLDAIHKDVKRLLNWLKHNEMLKGMMADPLVEEGVKGKVVKEVVEKAKLRRQVVAMVKMLVAKSKSGLVVQVMEEFQGIYYQLNSGFVG